MKTTKTTYCSLLLLATAPAVMHAATLSAFNGTGATSWGGFNAISGQTVSGGV